MASKLSITINLFPLRLNELLGHNFNSNIQAEILLFDQQPSQPAPIVLLVLRV
jgi:hypothetical protein